MENTAVDFKVKADTILFIKTLSERSIDASRQKFQLELYINLLSYGDVFPTLFNVLVLGCTKIK